MQVEEPAWNLWMGSLGLHDVSWHGWGMYFVFMCLPLVLVPASPIIPHSEPHCSVSRG